MVLYSFEHPSQLGWLVFIACAVHVRKESGGPASKNRRKDRVPNVKIQERKKIKNDSNNLEIDQVPMKKQLLVFS